MSIKPGALRFNTDSMKLEIFRGSANYEGSASMAGIGTLAAGQWEEIQATSPDVQTGGTRGVFSGIGGYPNITNVMNYVNISTTGDGTDFGDLTLPTRYGNAIGSRTRGIVYEGITPSATYDTDIQYFTFASTGNTIDFGGNSTQGRYGALGLSNSTRGLRGGGNTPSGNSDVIDYITMASTGVDAQDFGDLTTTILAGAAGNQVASSTRGIFAGGDTPTTIASMDFVTINTLGNAADFGDLNTARRSMMSASNATRGFVGGGTNPTMLSSIERIQLATLGSAVDNGDLSAAKQSGATSASSTRMVFAGGYAPAPTRVNVIEYKQFASDGDVIDFGDLLGATVNITGMSNGHGGLG